MSICINALDGMNSLLWAKMVVRRGIFCIRLAVFVAIATACHRALTASVWIRLAR